MGNEIQVRNRTPNTLAVMTTLTDGYVNNLKNLGIMVAQSGIFGEITGQAGAMAALTMLQENLSPLDFARRYHLIDGKPTPRADALLAMFVEKGGEYEIKEFSNERVIITFSYKKNKVTIESTLEQFKQNGVALGRNGQLKDNWRKFPRQMLFARTVSDGTRAVCPEIIFGMYTEEERADFNRGENPIEPADIPEAKSIEVLPSAKVDAVIEKMKQETKQKDEPEEAEVVNGELVEKPMPDPSICPIGKFKGEKWTSLTDEQLAAFLSCDRAKYPDLTIEHLTFIENVLEERCHADD